MNAELIDVLDRLQLIKSEAELKGVTEAALSNMGFETFSYFAFPKAMQPVGFSNYPMEWVQHYTENGYGAFDPAVTGGLRSRLPYQWFKHMPIVSGREKLLLNESAEFGICAGAAIPVHTGVTEMGMFFVSTSSDDGEFAALWKEHQYAVHLIATYFHSAFYDQVLKAELEQDVELTPRERECLYWASKGKSAWDTSVILNLAERTVNAHLQNAMQKLGCNSKLHTVVQAITKGLIVL